MCGPASNWKDCGPDPKCGAELEPSHRRLAVPGCRVLLTHPAPSWNPSCVFWNVPYSMPQGGWGWGLGPLTWRRGPGMRALMGFVARLSQASVSTESITAQSQSKHRNSTPQSEATEKMCSSPGEAKCAFPCCPVHCLIPSLYPWSVSPYSTGWRGCCRLLVEAGELSF